MTIRLCQIESNGWIWLGNHPHSMDTTTYRLYGHLTKKLMDPMDGSLDSKWRSTSSQIGWWFMDDDRWCKKLSLISSRNSTGYSSWYVFQMFFFCGFSNHGPLKGHLPKIHTLPVPGFFVIFCQPLGDQRTHFPGFFVIFRICSGHLSKPIMKQSAKNSETWPCCAHFDVTKGCSFHG